MCQPGRPMPHGLSQAGSPGLAAFQTAKSSGSCLAGLGVDAHALLELVDALPAELAVLGEAAHAEVDAAVRRVGVVRLR